MGSYETVVEYTIKKQGTVEHVRVRRTDDPKYPSGWDYALHFGTLDGETLLRYDNAHERTKGHERHTPEGVEELEFPGMFDLLDRFEREVTSLRTE